MFYCRYGVRVKMHQWSTGRRQGELLSLSCWQVCFGWTSQRHRLGFPTTARLEKAQKHSLTFLVQLKPESAGVWKMRVDLARTFWSSHTLTTKILWWDDFRVSFKLRIVHVTSGWNRHSWKQNFTWEDSLIILLHRAACNRSNQIIVICFS